MANLGEVTDEIAARFDLGSKAPAIVQGVLRFIAAEPGGFDGFLDKVKAAGLQVKAASWLGDPYPMALSKHEVKRALGAEQLKIISKTVGITEDFTSTVLGNAIPRIIGILAENCAILDTHPAILMNSVGPSTTSRSGIFEILRKKHMQKSGIEGFGDAPWRHLAVPGAALLTTLGLFGYVIASGTAGDQAAFETVPGAAHNAVAALLSQSAPGIETARNGASPAFAAGPREAAHMADTTSGVLAIKSGWLQNLAAVFGVLNSQDSQSLVAVPGINIGGTVRPADPSWKTPLFVVAELTDIGADNLRVALAVSQPGSRGNAPVRSSTQGALDFPSITFAANSAKLSSRNLPLLRRIAEQIKQLPPGTIVEINGYIHPTGMTGTAAANMELAQGRADSVYRILIRDGVSPAMLTSRGYGSSPAMASISGVTEGRSSKMTREGERPRDDRRVDFRVVQQHP